MNDQMSANIFAPLLAMLCLTMVVWCVLLYRRLGAARANGIGPSRLRTPNRVQELLPEHAMTPAYNLANLFELPVLFYVMCFYLHINAMVDGVFVLLAWIYFLLRLIHSIIHCSYNAVMHRFLAYLLSSVVLIILLIRTVTLSL
ncbi:MAPEG family protein [uncultured Pseudoteredinibacter sp.]|uniref:MAPEG family protein n=1 Tax=uncultured Pseudoteredinibacter sp. TaxID=1641701 RepID=UPI002610B2CF|nr:MAPEG family protein [uncultured Pseudoteredinibacter sp.]